MSLAQRQEELVRALVAGGAAPAGFDVDRLRIAEDALLRKRAGEVARHMPLARAQLGDAFVEAFMAWARGRQRGGSVADAEAFTVHLVSSGVWSPPADRRRWWNRRRSRSRG
ncbi:hypothetical protein GYA93_12000 [Gordonia desulfuricans]|uniref:SCO6045-like C-terminal domain-containing protein n=2 Tax=Gordoniaceae TaxID=85026 RepID=A0A7K3LPY4_9ACTN|nr:hypothetical protein ISGA_2182 [Gordonia sp. NB41Y]NDK90299.1 hypothetical protein [Gordonia desulfuricans]